MPRGAGERENPHYRMADHDLSGPDGWQVARKKTASM
jgi:hypothetical protein